MGDWFDGLSGLSPRVWLVVGAGFSREEVKTLFLNRGIAFTGRAVSGLQELCLDLVEVQPDRVLGPFARTEVIRLLLKEPRIMDRLPELAKLSRDLGFAGQIDRAFQMARMGFAHSEEEQVYFDRIAQLDPSEKKKQLREELSKLSAAYQAWCAAEQLWDLPLLMRQAIERLQEGWPEHLGAMVRPSEIVFLSQSGAESLEKHLREALSRWVSVREVTHLGDLSHRKTELRTEVWHTLEDAAYALQERLLRSSLGGADLSEVALLIPDHPQVRRSAFRAIAQSGIPLADPRDPTLFRMQEIFKTLLLPLQVTAFRYERTQVGAWISQFAPKEKRTLWLKSLASSGVRRSLEPYKNVDLGLWQHLQTLETVLGGRRTCAGLKKAWTELWVGVLAQTGGPDLGAVWGAGLAPDEIRSGMEAIGAVWDQILKDMVAVGEEAKTGYPRFWLESLRGCLNEASPPAERNKVTSGVQVYRLTQAPTQKFKQVWIFGLPQNILENHFGDLWLTDRDRRALAKEFDVTSSFQKAEETLEVLRKWRDAAEEWLVFDATYDMDGRERGAIAAILKLIFPEVSEVQVLAAGGHPVLEKPRTILAAGRPRTVLLPEIKEKRISATALDRMSRCPFQALALHRWNLWDQREAGVELWPDSRGNLLHEAVRNLLSTRNDQGGFGVTPSEALDEAWRRRRPPGLLKAQRVENYVRRRMLPILTTFCEKEKEFFQRSGVSVIPKMLDDCKVQWSTTDGLGNAMVLHGKPDRVEEHPDGLFVIDYKTSGSIPNGIDILKKGQRLQLPFYALALEKSFKRPVIGLLLVELDRKAGRKSGILFQPWNSKEQGSLTQLRKGSKSLILDLAPDEAWDILGKTIALEAHDYLAGKYRVCPKGEIARGPKVSECSRCMVANLCGLGRPENAPKSGAQS